jgi:hypothetical protein
MIVERVPLIVRIVVERVLLIVRMIVERCYYYILFAYSRGLLEIMSFFRPRWAPLIHLLALLPTVYIYIDLYGLTNPHCSAG